VNGVSELSKLRLATQLPIIVDVSHALGRKDILKPIARAALAAGADGLMFESHYNPASALSDAGQQLDLKETEELIAYLEQCAEFSKDTVVVSTPLAS
jgi:3-deoxy-7-phosphoheptulonate synthase/chorismate mutase